jgi:hypothetical protein
VNTKKEPAVILLFDSARGIYIPQNFAEEIQREYVSGVDAETYETLAAGPDGEWYWEAWQDVLDNAVLTIGGDEYMLYQDGDAWALCLERMDAEEKANFGFED